MKEQTLQAIITKVLLSEYGGCDPRTDNPCILKARVRREYLRIEVFVVGKWRPVRGYNGTVTEVTNKKILKDMERTVRCNTGTTFAGKAIQFKWEA